jgi:hypothetical protein
MKAMPTVQIPRHIDFCPLSLFTTHIAGARYFVENGLSSMNKHRPKGSAIVIHPAVLRFSYMPNLVFEADAGYAAPRFNFSGRAAQHGVGHQF